MQEYKRHPNTKCVVCGEFVYRRPAEIQKNKGKVYCTSVCYGLASRKESPCMVCGTPILAGAHKKTCSRLCANRHRTGIRYKLSEPRKDKVKSQRTLKLRLLRQRGTVCERCGYSKYEVLQVHHRDRDTNNSNLKNLELICPNCHAEEHYLENSWLRDKQYNGGVG